jgi:hypothetical protein
VISILGALVEAACVSTICFFRLRCLEPPLCNMTCHDCAK